MTTDIKIMKDDITKIRADAIVNAANSSLLGGGGVDGAIHRAGGSQILAECRRIAARQGGCPPGEAVITSAGKLPAKYVIHTVGPVWHGGNNNEADLLADCYRNSLRLGEKNKIKSIAFPNISTGVYGYPKNKAVSVAAETVRSMTGTLEYIENIIFVCFDDENYELYRQKFTA